MGLLELMKVIIISITEGITEWLPISSTGHMILISELIKPNLSDSFIEMFLVVIQLGAIFAVPTLYFERIFPVGNKFDLEARHEVYSLWKKVIVGTLPTLFIGLLFELCDIDGMLKNNITVAIALIVYGIIYIVLPKIISSRKQYVADSRIGLMDALCIGAFQSLSLVPGTSRSGVTMLGGMILGKSAVASTEFSFFMAIPAMLGASVLKIVKFLSSGLALNTEEWTYLLTGVLVSYCVSIISIRYLLSFVKRHGLRFFGIYRIVLGFVVILFHIVKKCG